MVRLEPQRQYSLFSSQEGGLNHSIITSIYLIVNTSLVVLSPAQRVLGGSMEPQKPPLDPPLICLIQKFGFHLVEELIFRKLQIDMLYQMYKHITKRAYGTMLIFSTSSGLKLSKFSFWSHSCQKPLC